MIYREVVPFGLRPERPVDGRVERVRSAGSQCVAHIDTEILSESVE